MLAQERLDIAAINGFAAIEAEFVLNGSVRSRLPKQIDAANPRRLAQRLSRCRSIFAVCSAFAKRSGVEKLSGDCLPGS